jgi:hypothetical protein
MKHAWIAVALLNLACLGGVEDAAGSKNEGTPLAVEVDACTEGETAECAHAKGPGRKTCEIGETGFVWGECKQRLPDDCSAGEVKQCFAEGSWQSKQFGNLSARCELIDGRYTFPVSACATPLVLAFDDEPVTFTQAPGTFDLFGQNLSIGTDWVGPRTPWLVLDRDQDGRIADGSELFGSMTVLPGGARARDGFEALLPLDADHDGWLTERDPGFAELKLWSDTDQDRVSSAAELHSLASAGVEAIELANRVVPRCSPSGCELERSRLVFRDATGSRREGAVVDVHLRGF